MQKVTVTPIADITSLMTGTTAPWFWEVTEAYVAGVSTAFTWADGVLTISGYTTGSVLVVFTLYLIHDSPSDYYTSDPTDSGSAVVFWENRLKGFISYSVGIKSFETGLTDIGIGNVSIQIDDDWLGLIQQPIIFSNRTVRIYSDDVLVFKGISTRSSVSGYTLSINLQKRQTILESELNWGDDAYLNRIDRSTSTSYYNGANIPEKYEGYAIPMLFGNQTPYEQTQETEVDIAEPTVVFITPPSTKTTAQFLNTSSVCIQVIPTGTDSGIIGKMPAYQTISTSPIAEALTGQAHIWGRYEQASNSTILDDMIPGEVCVLDKISSIFFNPARLIYKRVSDNRGVFLLGIDDVDSINYENISSCDANQHFFPTDIPDSNWTGGAILSSATTPAGHRWITVTGLTGINLESTELFVVLTNISGAKSAPEVMEFALEEHGFTVDSASFSAAVTAFPELTYQQAGFQQNVPTLAGFISEINRSLMTVLVFPASNDVPFLKIIDPTEASSQTIDERQITQLSTTNEYRDQAKEVIFRPKYAKSDIFKNDLYLKQPASNAALLASEKTINIDHVLDDVPTRFNEITEIYGSPTTTVSFTLLDDTVTLEVADVVYIDHTEFKNKILITVIETLPLGRKITGRYFYVN